MDNQLLIHFWSWLDVVVLFATVASGAALCLIGRAPRPRLMVLPLFGLYQAVMSVLLFAIALQPVPNHNYWLGYWYGSIGENVLLCLLAIELTCNLLPKKQLAMAWCAALALLMVLSVGASMPARTEAKLMNATMAGDFTSGLVLVALLYATGIRISRPYQFIVAGVLVPAGVHALGTLKWMHGDLAPIAAAALPMSSLAGLVLMLAASVIALKQNGADCSAPLLSRCNSGKAFGTTLPDDGARLEAHSNRAPAIKQVAPVYAVMVSAALLGEYPAGSHASHVDWPNDGVIPRRFTMRV